MHFFSLALLAVLYLPAAAAVGSGHSAKGWGARFKTLVAFGDSYTDEGRLGYFIEHAGAAPPAGWVGPDSATTASGGRSWARYVSYNTGATLYNYGVSGASCSNHITPRYFSAIDGLFPSVSEYEIPAFAADLRRRLRPAVHWDSTVVALWIGTNDLGGDALLSDSQVAGTTIVDYTRCVFRALQDIYALGARRFVLLNVVPLELSPLYAADSPPGANRYWQGRGDNTTAISAAMAESVAVTNEIFRLRAAMHGMKGARLALLDAHGLLKDVHDRPRLYLNGSAPLNVTGYNSHCNADSSECFNYRMEDRDSFLWFDELHPGEQMGRVLAKEFAEAVRGRGRWTTFW